MKKIIICVYIIIFMIPFSIKAYECTDEDQERLKSLINNINYTIDEKITNNKMKYVVTFTGLSKELKIYSFSDYRYYINTSDSYFGEVRIGNLLPDNVYEFNISGIQKCGVNNLKTVVISIPKWNEYSADSICDDAKSLSICWKHNQTNLTYEEVSKKIEEYKNEIKNNDIKTDVNNDIDSIERLFYYYDKYYKPFLFITIGLFLLLVILVTRRNKKNKL